MADLRATLFLSVSMLVLSGVSGHAQQRDVTLPQIDVQGAAAEADRSEGPVTGYVADQTRSATKTATPLTEIPQSISIVTSDQMKVQGAQTVGQALRYTPGVVADPSGGNDSQRYDFQNIRGLPYVGRHYLDGMKATFGTGNIAMPSFDTFMLERVEVLRGPGSVLFGQNDPGGLINMISKRPTATPFGEITLSLGNHGHRQATLDTSGKLNEDGSLLYRLGILGRMADNQVDFVESERFLIAPSFTWRPSADTSLTILTHYQRDPKGGYYGSFPELGTLREAPFGKIRRSFNPGEPGFDHFSRTQYGLGYVFDHRFNDVWSVRQNLRYLDSKADVRAVSANMLIPPTMLNRSSLAAHGHTRSLTIDNQLQAEFDAGAVKHTLLFGLDYLKADWQQFQGLGAFGVPPIDVLNPQYGSPVPVPDSHPAAMVLSQGNYKQSQLGLYAQDQMKFGGFTLTGGVRYDWAKTQNDRDSSLFHPLIGLIDTSVHDKTKDGSFSGRVGLNYQFDNGLAPYVSYSTSFIPVLGIGGGAKSFVPLEGEQTEIGIKYQPLGSKHFVGVALFDIKQKNALTPDPDPMSICVGLAGPGPCQIQTGEMRSRGLEIEGKLSLSDNASLIASYTYLDTTITRSNGPDLGKRPVNTPAHMAALWADYRFTEGALSGLGLGAGVRYFGRTYADTLNTTTVPSYTLVDAALWYDLGALSRQLKGYSLKLNVSNLLDETYVSCSATDFCNYGLGRTVVGSVSYRW